MLVIFGNMTNSLETLENEGSGLKTSKTKSTVLHHAGIWHRMLSYIIYTFLYIYKAMHLQYLVPTWVIELKFQSLHTHTHKKFLPKATFTQSENQYLKQSDNE